MTEGSTAGSIRRYVSQPCVAPPFSIPETRHADIIVTDLPTSTKKSLLRFGIQNTPVRNLVTTGLYFTKNSYFSHNCQLHTFFWVSTPCLAIRVHAEWIIQHEIKDQNAIVNFVPLLGPPSWLFSGALFSRETYASLLDLVNLYD